MKKLFFTLYLLCSLSAFAQKKNEPDHILISKFPASGFLMDKGWKFHPGDIQEWDKIPLNDSTWQDIDPTKPIQYLHQVRAAQIGWLRLHFRVDEALRGKMVAFAVHQIGASEIYLNGNLIKKYGKVSNRYEEEVTYNPFGQPLTIQLDGEAEQVLTVLYSFNKDNLYPGVGSNKVFQIVMNNPETAWTNYTNSSILRSINRSIVWAVFIILSILQLSIYLADRSRRINLMLSLFTFFQSCTFIDGPLRHFFYSANAQFYISGRFYIAAHICYVFFLWVVYDLFKQDKNWWFKSLVAVYLLSLPIGFVEGGKYSWIALTGSGMLVYLEILRISIIAFKKKYPGSTLFLIGQSIALFFYSMFNFFPGNYHPQILYLEVDIAFLTPAVVISILLAREFAQNNISLKQQVGKVEELSARTLAQELEKQQLLSSQNERLEAQVQQRTTELSESLKNLQSTQTQLIHSEKMASLGELTAGIAHEIQNPLNFVNNFSEVSLELIEEVKSEKSKIKSERNEELENELLEDISQNLQKISHHGKRADFIVKGMLQHSRTSTGEKQLTNVNTLADEFLKLSYHGLRAKDKTFNAELITNLDQNLPKVNLVQQDIGRVLLNLFNNAFYAVSERKKSKEQGAKNKEEYKPTVEVSTSSKEGFVTIIVKDNGIGIPEAIKEKIMQPFFTTKPTGEGTGLGLSLSYDIIKAHGGEIKVETRPDRVGSDADALVGGDGGSEFIIQLPL